MENRGTDLAAAKVEQKEAETTLSERRQQQAVADAASAAESKQWQTRPQTVAFAGDVTQEEVLGQLETLMQGMNQLYSIVQGAPQSPSRLNLASIEEQEPSIREEARQEADTRFSRLLISSNLASIEEQEARTREETRKKEKEEKAPAAAKSAQEERERQWMAKEAEEDERERAYRAREEARKQEEEQAAKDKEGVHACTPSHTPSAEAIAQVWQQYRVAQEEQECQRLAREEEEEREEARKREQEQPAAAAKAAQESEGQKQEEQAAAVAKALPTKQQAQSDDSDDEEEERQRARAAKRIVSTPERLNMEKEEEEESARKEARKQEEQAVAAAVARADQALARKKEEQAAAAAKAVQEEEERQRMAKEKEELSAREEALRQFEEQAAAAMAAREGAERRRFAEEEEARTSEESRKREEQAAVMSAQEFAERQRPLSVATEAAPDESARRSFRDEQEVLALDKGKEEDTITPAEPEAKPAQAEPASMHVQDVQLNAAILAHSAEPTHTNQLVREREAHGLEEVPARVSEKEDASPQFGSALVPAASAGIDVQSVHDNLSLVPVVSGEEQAAGHQAAKDAKHEAAQHDPSTLESRVLEVQQDGDSPTELAVVKIQSYQRGIRDRTETEVAKAAGVLPGQLRESAKSGTLLSVDEAMTVFEEMDVNRNGEISQIELIKALRSNHFLAQRLGLPNQIRQEEESRRM